MRINSYFIILFIIAFSCKPKQEREAIDLLGKSIEAHGGEKAFEDLNEIQFRKWTQLLDENGDVESETDQLIQFKLKPQLTGKITWEKDSVSHVIEFDGEKTFYSLGGNSVQNVDFLEAKKKEFDAAYYVVAQPWKLLQDEGAKLSYEGEKEVFSKTVKSIRVEYGPDQDVWWYYFDPNSNLMAGNEIQLKDHRSQIENLSFSQVLPFIFYGQRESFRIDENGNKLYLRAVYSYSDFQLK